MRLSLRVLQAKEYLHFRRALYRGDLGYVCTEEFVVEMLLKQTTDFAKGCTVKPVGVFEGEKLVCQCLFVIAPGLNALQIAYFESLPDRAAAVSFLWREAERFAVEQGQGQIIVGLLGHLSYGVGILTHGFAKNTFDSHYNKPYYHGFFQQDWSWETLTAYRADMAEIRKIPRPSTQLTVRKLRLYRFRQEMETFRRLCDRTIGETQLYTPTQPGHFYQLLRDMRFFLQPENILFVCDGGVEVGFLFWYPDYNEVLEPGRQYSMAGIAARYLRHRKRIRTIKINAIGVVEPYRSYGVSLLLHQLQQYGAGYQAVETSFVWDSNGPSSRLNQAVLGEISRTYHVYHKKVGCHD